METKLLMGNEAMGLAAVRAGVNFVCGYPGTPSTEVLETVARHNSGSIHVEWSVNEKVALEAGAGASYAGARVLVTMKQVGLNVASDPLMCLSYMGVKGGMVLLVADDPGPISSQTEQDTRMFARYANLPVLDPSSPEEACAMMYNAFSLSEQFSIPVILRPTTRICHACASIPALPAYEPHHPAGFEKDPKWVIFPALSYRNHIALEQKQTDLAALFSTGIYNTISGDGSIGVAAGGVAYSYAKEAIADLDLPVRLFKVGAPYPFPDTLAQTFLSGLTEVLVIEELDPVIEDSLLSIAAGCGVSVHGKRDGSLPFAGEYNYESVSAAIAGLAGINAPCAPIAAPVAVPLPTRPPVLCAGCPHRAAFYAVKKAIPDGVYSGDIGCYTLGNAAPLHMVDTCLCMGAGITVAQGVHHIDPSRKNVAFIGDSTFFHSGITGIINAAYNQADITVVVLDNSTTAMTGHQPHPGTGKTMMGKTVPRIKIDELARAAGAGYVAKADPLQQKDAVRVLKEAAAHPGVSVVIFESPCISLFKPQKTYTVGTNCIRCKKCIRELGCPALSAGEDGSVTIEQSMCYGCGLCTAVCPAGAIRESEARL